MVLIDQIWDDTVAGPPPAVSGLKHLKKLYSNPSTMKDVGAESSSRSLSMPTSPTTPETANNLSPTAGQKNNVWRSVFNPGSNQATKNVGADYFDKPQHANAPTVYDCVGFTVGSLGTNIAEEVRQLLDSAYGGRITNISACK